MATQDWTRVWILLEGEADWDILKTFFIENNVTPIKMSYGEGKEQIIEAIRELNLFRISGINYVGIVDADFDRILNTLRDLENLCHSETHDLDLDIIKSGALFRFLDTHTDEDLLLRVTGINTRSEANEWILSQVVSSAAHLGHIRLACYVKGIPLRKYKMRKYCLSQFEVQTDNLVQDIMTKHIRASLTITIHEIRNEDYDQYQIANGHDVIEILSSSLNQFYKKSCRNLDTGKMESAIKGCFSLDHFKNMDLYTSIMSWQTKHNWEIVLQ